MRDAVNRRLYRALTLAIWVASAVAQAGIAPSYYDSAITTSSGVALKDSLHNIVKAGAVALGYDNTWDPLRFIDQSTTSSSDVRLIYGAGTRDKFAGGAQDGNPLTGGWSREHGFPQSFYDQEEPMRSDIHALFPADADINNRRSNSPYDYVPAPTYTDELGNRATTSFFEPSDADKGRAARAILYMDMRYDGTGGEPDLVTLNTYPAGTGFGQMAYLNTLLAWHRMYPPTAFEKARNYKAYRYQNNANPFVDHPEWVAPIFGGNAWAMENGNTITVAGDSPATRTVSAGSTSIPVVYIPTQTTGQEVLVASLAVENMGTLPDYAINQVQWWFDTDSDGLVSPADSLLGENYFVSGLTSFTLSHPFICYRGFNQFLISADLNFQGLTSQTLQLKVQANSMGISATGGNDIPPVFPALISNAYEVTNPLTEISNLRITEVMEGMGNLKYIELYNSTSATIDLATANLQLRRYTNGSTTPQTIALSTGRVPAGGFYVIANNLADFQAVFGFAPQAVSGSITHNGDDVYDLYQTAAAVVIDSFAGDRIGDATSFNTDRVAYRVIPALPNVGQWGATGPSLPPNGGLSPSGYWKVRTITTSNGNAAQVGTPGSLAETASAIANWSDYDENH